MNALEVLKQRRAAAKARRDALVDEAEALPTPQATLEALNASEKERADLDREIVSLDSQVTAEERRRSEIVNAPALPVDAVAMAAQVAASAKPQADDKPPTPFRSLGDQMFAIAAYANGERGRAPDPGLAALMDWEDEQLRKAAIVGGSTVVGSDGGFLLQTDIAGDLVQDVFSEGRLAQRCQTREIGPGFDGAAWNSIDETSRADGSRYGGVQAYWVAEGGQITASRPKVKKQKIENAKLVGMYVATSEELRDPRMLQSFARPAFISEFAFKVDDALVRGSGAGVPLGILDAGNLVSVTKETGQPAATVLWDNVRKMFVRMAPGSMATAAWFINLEVYPQLEDMSMVIGTGGLPVFLPPAAGAGAPYGTLRGRPIVPIEHASALGTVGDIIFADWNEYLLITAGGIEEATSIHVYFDTDQQVFRWILHTNGRPIRTNTVTPYKGSLVTSPFVVLQTRD